MIAPKHTPYDGSSPHFAIGLRPLDLRNWIEVDGHLSRYLDEKKRLMGSDAAKVWVAEPDSKAGQQEVLDLLTDYLPDRFPQVYSVVGDEVRIAEYERVNIRDASSSPLLIAAQLVQEDLVLMQKGEEGWRIAAGSVCFPSSWVLREKFGKVMHDVHAPVPGFAKGTRNAMMIERIFDNLHVDEPVERFNWSVYSDDRLYHSDRAGEHFPNFAKGEYRCYLRVEHQTLRKLPKSGDILFTIRIHIDPLDVLKHRPDKKILAEQFIGTIGEMSNDQLVYKGLDKGRDELIGQLMKVTQDK